MHNVYASGRARIHEISSCVSDASVTQIGGDLELEDKPGVHQGVPYDDDERCYNERGQSDRFRLVRK